MNDLEIAKRIAQGDAEATEKFVRDQYASVYRAMRHLTRHREDAEDLTQQAFISARSKIDTFRGASSLKTWIHRIAFNEYAQWKRQRRQTSPLKLDHAKDEPGYGAFVASESLLESLAALPDKLREAIILHEVEGLSVDEVAQIMRVPSGTVKARLFYARRRLRVLLEDGAEVVRNETKQAVI